MSADARVDTRVSRPTYTCNHSAQVRGSDILSRCKDIVFREAGECAHRFDVRSPAWLGAEPDEHGAPLARAEVHSLRSSSVDPRTGGDQVFPSVKWLNDELDSVRLLSSDPQMAGSSLLQDTQDSENRLILELRVGTARKSTNTIRWATSRFSEGDYEEIQHDPDLWEHAESDALTHVLHTLTGLSVAYAADANSEMSHGEMDVLGQPIEVFAIRGETHSHCARHFDRLRPALGRDPVLVVLRDMDNGPLGREAESIHEPQGEAGVSFIDYRSLKDALTGAADHQGFRNAIDDLIPTERKIV